MQRICFAVILAMGMLTSAGFADTAELIKTIRAVGEKGSGQKEAIAAVKELSSGDEAAAMECLKAMHGANPLALNWLQGTFETIAGRDGVTIEKATLEKFVLDREQNARARRVAFEALVRVDETATKRLVPGFVDDPSAPLRRDAIAHWIKQAEAAEGDAAVALWKKALSGVVDEDQYKVIAGALRKAGDEVNLVHHFGFLMSWKVIGPFDNREKKGFDVAYPPEAKIDFDAEYEDFKGKVKWESFNSEEKDGKFDIAKLTEPHKGAIDYAYTEFNSHTDQDIEFRLSIKNAWKIWVNGELLFAREEYHRGTRFDQYKVPVHLKKGTNTILLKVCQNEQDEDWAQDWMFKLRVCDSSGRAIHPVERTASAK